MHRVTPTVDMRNANVSEKHTVTDHFKRSLLIADHFSKSSTVDESYAKWVMDKWINPLVFNFGILLYVYTYYIHAICFLFIVYIATVSGHIINDVNLCSEWTFLYRNLIEFNCYAMRCSVKTF